MLSFVLPTFAHQDLSSGEIMPLNKQNVPPSSSEQDIFYAKVITFPTCVSQYS